MVPQSSQGLLRLKRGHASPRLGEGQGGASPAWYECRVEVVNPIVRLRQREALDDTPGKDPGDVSTIKDEGSIDEAREAWRAIQAEMAARR
jgi:hypothetical protein